MRPLIGRSWGGREGEGMGRVCPLSANVKTLLASTASTFRVVNLYSACFLVSIVVVDHTCS